MNVAIFGLALLASCAETGDSEYVDEWVTTVSLAYAHNLCHGELVDYPDFCQDEGSRERISIQIGESVASCWAKTHVAMAEEAEIPITNVLLPNDGYLVDTSSIALDDFNERTKHCVSNAFREAGMHPKADTR